MKVSLNQLRFYRERYHWSDDPALQGINELVARIGSQLGEVEGVVDLGSKYKGILVAKIIKCEDHPNADRLHVCTIDDGGAAKDVSRDENGYVQVVCGAPNVREGLLVAWLPPGSTVPESVGKEPFVLEARNLRGVVSNGMLASPRELALGDIHDGILEIDDPDVKPGDDFAKVYGLDDFIIEIENKMFTHRPDCFGMLGVARELAGIQQLAFKSPEWWCLDPAVPAIDGQALPLLVKNELPELVPRFAAIAMSNITIKPSPLWLQINLLRLGVRPINNIVDLTNYYMLLTGQPLHAYDYDKVKALSEGDGAALVVRNPRENEKITLLNGKTIDPRQEAVMIATDKQLIGVGGVMGGSETEVDEHTTNIILEVATFDMYSIRRTSMAHGLFTDAVTRFSKGQSPLQNQAVLARIVSDITDLVGGKVASEFIDDNHIVGREWVHPPVKVSAEFINARLGLNLSAEAMKKLLVNVEFVVDVEGENLTVTAPFWRTDIELREDVVEEVGRLYGYDKLPLILPKRDISPATKDPMLALKARIRASLAKAGANEVLTYSFVHGKLLDNVTQNRDQAFKVSNALSPDLQYYRLHALPSLLDKVHANIKAGYDEFALFELNKGHNLLHKDDDDGVPTEIEFLDFVYAAKNKQPGAAFYEVRKYLDVLAADLGIVLSYAPVPEDPHVPVSDPYDYTRSAFVSVAGGDFLGMVGELKQSVLKSLKLPSQTAVFTIGPAQLKDAMQKASNSYQQLPKFPRVEQDICLKVAADLHYQELHDFVAAEINSAKPEQTITNISPIDIYQRDDDSDHKQITFRLAIASFEKTMTDPEVAKILDAVTAAAHAKYQAERI